MLYIYYGCILSAFITNADLAYLWPSRLLIFWHFFPSDGSLLLSCWTGTACPYLQTFDYSLISLSIVFNLLLKDQPLPLIGQWCQSLVIFLKFLFSSVVFFVVKKMLQQHLDSCISTASLDSSMKLSLTMMVTDLPCPLSFVPPPEKIVSLYTLFISIYCVLPTPFIILSLGQELSFCSLFM